MKYEKVEISIELLKICCVSDSNLGHMLIDCRCDAAKTTPNTNRHNLACNNLEYNKLKASTHVINSKAQCQTNPMIKHMLSKKLQRGPKVALTFATEVRRKKSVVLLPSLNLDSVIMFKQIAGKSKSEVSVYYLAVLMQCCQ